MGNNNKIRKNPDGSLKVPDRPVIPYIEGDGIGPDIWRATRRVIDGAVKKAYEGRRGIVWLEVAAGEKSFQKTGRWLPDETLAQIEEHRVAIKGPEAGSVCLHPAGKIYCTGSQPPKAS